MSELELLIAKKWQIWFAIQLQFDKSVQLLSVQDFVGFVSSRFLEIIQNAFKLLVRIEAQEIRLKVLYSYTILF